MTELNIYGYPRKERHMASRDVQHPRIAAATKALEPGYPMTEVEAKRFIAKINRSAWWRRNRRSEADLILDLGKVESHTFRPNTPNGLPVDGCGYVAPIGIEKHALSQLEILHRVAHFTCEAEPGDPPHGPRFAKALAEAVRKFIGPDAKRALVGEFKTHKVKYIVHSAESREAARHRKARADIIALAKELAS